MGLRDHIPCLLLLKNFMSISRVAIVIYVVIFLAHLRQLTKGYRMYYIQFAYADKEMTEQSHM